MSRVCEGPALSLKLLRVLAAVVRIFRAQAWCVSIQMCPASMMKFNLCAALVRVWQKCSSQSVLRLPRTFSIICRSDTKTGRTRAVSTN
jgi:hypothetical protein